MVWIAGGPSGPRHWTQCSRIPAVERGQVARGRSALAWAMDLAKKTAPLDKCLHSTSTPLL